MIGRGHWTRRQNDRGGRDKYGTKGTSRMTNEWLSLAGSKTISSFLVSRTQMAQQFQTVAQSWQQFGDAMVLQLFVLMVVVVIVVSTAVVGSQLAVSPPRLRCKSKWNDDAKQTVVAQPRAHRVPHCQTHQQLLSFTRVHFGRAHGQEDQCNGGKHQPGTLLEKGWSRWWGHKNTCIAMNLLEQTLCRRDTFVDRR